MLRHVLLLGGIVATVFSGEVQAALFVLNAREVSVKVPSSWRNASAPSLKVYLDRAVYLDHDREGQGLVVISPATLLMPGRDSSLRDHRVRIQVTDVAGVPAGEGVSVPLASSDHIAFDVDVPQMPVGKFKAQAVLIDGTGREIASGACGFEKERGAAPTPGGTVQVPLVLFRADRVGDARDVPISTGIPMPEGLLDDPSNVRLIEDGKEMPCQTVARARWSPKGSVRWLGLDFQARYEGGLPHSYALEVGAAGTSTPQPPVVLTETPDRFVIVNGPGRAIVSRRSFRLFEEVRLDGNGDGVFADDEILIKASAAEGPYWVNAAGKSFRACRDTAPEVRVEESGSLRVTLRADTWLVGDDGARAGKSVTRMSWCAGRPEIPVNQTFIVTWDTLDRDMRVRDMGVAVATPGTTQALFTHVFQKLPDLPEKGTIYLLQDRWSRFMVRRSDTNGPSLWHSQIADGWGNNMKGWGAGVSPAGAVAVCQRHLWELFPKEIEVGRGSLVWHAWPLHGTETIHTGLDLDDFVNLRWLHQGTLLDFQIPESYERTMQEFKGYDPKPSWRWGGEMNLSGYAMGTAISGELCYLFAPASKNADRNVFEGRAAQFQAALHAIADPEWTSATKILDGPSPVQAEYSQIEEGLSSMFDRSMSIIEKNREYGQFIWPNGHVYSPPTLHRCRLNGHHGVTTVGWNLYLRSGEKKYWDFARNRTRQCLDNASVNYDPMNMDTDREPRFGRWPGAACHCDGYVPWGSYSELWGHCTPIHQASLLYHLTGDSRGLDLVRMWAESVLKKYRTPEDFPIPVFDRNPVVGWSMAVEYYADFQDPRMLRLIGDFRDGLFRQDLKIQSGSIPQGERYWLGTYLRRWRDPVVRQRFLDWMNDYRNSSCVSRETQIATSGPGECHIGPWFFSDHYAMAAELTGDLSYVRNYWFDTQGLEELRQWALKPTADQPVNQQELADSYYPALLYLQAMRRAGLSEVPCVYPGGPKSCVAMLKERDRPFTLTLWGHFGIPPLPYKLIAPDGRVVSEGTVPAGVRRLEDAVLVKVEADGKTGEYQLIMPGRYGADAVCCPISDLPKEVYVVPVGDHGPGTRYFWRSGPNEREKTFLVGGGAVQLETVDGLPILLKSTPDSNARMVFPVKPDTMYRLTMTGTFGPRSGDEMVLSADESRWFRPTARR